MIIYLATWLFEPNQGNTLTKMGKQERLINYYHTTLRKKEFIRYVKTGRNDRV